ncbi:DUF6340 family protein [Dysgonomonas sp. Marseille-P4361]|uniref:DUF6340 family protein n=1 Tax=Dysgonomonas sp. Marseille-P4361 TaxID=2161820 RepID=UPI00135AA231|nr:DUF6340 family protein [Dysgonomonas sp. Marseille-P4361]
MKKWLFFILTVVIFTSLHSCVTMEYIYLDIRQPAHVTFPSGTSKVIITDNSFKAKHPTDSLSQAIQLRNFLIDSIRPALLNNIALFMSEDGLIDTVEVYPYHPRPLYLYYENDSLFELPLTKEDIRDICYQSDANALISLDFIDISISRINKNLYRVTNDYTIRNYSALGDSLTPPIINRITLPLGGDNYSLGRLYKYLIYEYPVQLADLLVDLYIPKWETQERILFTELPDKAKEASNLMRANMWKEAFIEWEKAFNNTKNKKQKIIYASNMALACEYKDDLKSAQIWINAANDLLSKNDDGELTNYVRYYKSIIKNRAKNAPMLKRQLDLSIEEDILMDSQ